MAGGRASGRWSRDEFTVTLPFRRPGLLDRAGAFRELTIRQVIGRGPDFSAHLAIHLRARPPRSRPWRSCAHRRRRRCEGRAGHQRRGRADARLPRSPRQEYGRALARPRPRMQPPKGAAPRRSWQQGPQSGCASESGTPPADDPSSAAARSGKRKRRGSFRSLPREAREHWNESGVQGRRPRPKPSSESAETEGLPN